MRNKIERMATEINMLWADLTMESVHKIKAGLESLVKSSDVQSQIQRETRGLPKGLELYRDKNEGFVLLAYSEARGTYRMPHNHGNAWVLYVVVSGEVEMGSYFNAIRKDGSDHLIRKDRKKLVAGDTRIYFPGEIHDTLCVSDTAEILRLTSLDLKEEEQSGRMQRFQYTGA